eukprot:TRINITY_DN23756_c0_g3_i1.p1 TRINITY_DN23756_c0_g3~~TRINITY_DN23756_c0_g3_i1.p1  ORF type:complete len:991 (+),score=166.49 TRINITY_DN23756_c0_g3_i1:95-3067(+)
MDGMASWAMQPPPPAMMPGMPAMPAMPMMPQMPLMPPMPAMPPPMMAQPPPPAPVAFGSAAVDMPPPPPQMAPGQVFHAPSGDLFETVRTRAIEREHARRKNDYAQGDAIRDDLIRMGVQLHDKTHTFVLPDGRQGSYDLNQSVAMSRPPPSTVSAAPSSLPRVTVQAEPPVIDDFFKSVRRRALDREEARKANDYTRADSIRDEIQAMDVQLFDKTHTFVLPDGRQGSYDLNLSDPAAELSADLASASGDSDPDLFIRVQKRALEREEARRKNDYATGDAIREELAALGVQLHDKNHIFVLRDGRQGSFDLNLVPLSSPPAMMPPSMAPPASEPPSDLFAKVHQRALEREEARKAGDYDAADVIRDELAAMGVQLFDKTHTFVLPGGVQGSYNLNAADKSSSNFAQVQKRALEREEARRANDYKTADAIRDELRGMGVELVDKTHTFILADGTQGSYDLNSELSVTASPVASAPLDEGFFFRVQKRAFEREEARKAGDYDLGDKIRDELMAMGVTLFDKTHMFVLANGRQGSYDLALQASIAPPQNTAPTDPQLFSLVQKRTLEREEARRSSDYQTSDAIRDELVQLGVRLDDKTHTFVLPDGSQGSYDLSNKSSTPGPPVSGSAASPSFQHVHQICLEREQARKDQDYAQSDRIRQKLEGMGVRLDDKTHTFFMPDGSRGSYDLHTHTPQTVTASAASQPLISFEGVRAKCLQREEARKRGDYMTSDQIRDELNRHGVHLEDKQHTFTTPDGRKGSYSLNDAPSAPPVVQQSGPAAHLGYAQAAQAAHAAAYYQMYPHLAGQPMAYYPTMPGPPGGMLPGAPPGGMPPPPPPMGAPPGAVGRPRSASMDHVRQYCIQREEVRKNGDYKTADLMRSELTAMGVRLEDKTHTFFLPDGSSGSYDLSQAPATAELGDGSFAAVRAYCLKREEVRKQGDYRSADHMRQKLTAIGVRLEDKSHIFTMADGTTGSYDLNSESEPASKRPRLDEL